MKTVKITQKILDYIQANQEKFEFDSDEMPKLGDVWYVTGEHQYPVAFNGKPVLDLENGNCWMKLQKDLCEIEDEAL